MSAYELIVIGAGPGGYEAALHAAASGMKTALVERREVGGTCLNRGCIPTKALLHSAEVYESVLNAKRAGIEAGEPRLDEAAVRAFKDDTVERLRGGVEGLLAKAKVELIRGSGMITAPGEVTVSPLAGEGEADGGEEEKLGARFILIATGSKVSIPPVSGMDLSVVMTSDDVLTGEKWFCDDVIIIGGGVIGVELAFLYSAFGASVKIIEYMPRLLPPMDKEISQSVKMLLKKRGVDIHTSAQVVSVSDGGDGNRLCIYKEKDEEVTASAKAVIVCTGRRPETDGLFADPSSVKTERGVIVTDEHGRTSMDGVYAIGDVSGGMMLAHAASAAGRNAVDHMLGREAKEDLSLIPSCVYTCPEIAQVGLTQDDAAEKGIEADSVKYVMSSNGRTVISSGERGYIRVVFEKGTGKLLGAQMMCERATDLVSVFANAISGGMTVDDMGRTVWPHPTFSEGIGEVIRAAGE